MGDYTVLVGRVDLVSHSKVVRCSPCHPVKLDPAVGQGAHQFTRKLAMTASVSVDGRTARQTYCVEECLSAVLRP